MDKTTQDAIITEIAAVFAWGLPEHEQRKRLSTIVAAVYAEGQRNPKIVKLDHGVAVRKGARK